MSEEQEKDNFFLYIGIGVVLFISVIFMVKNNESGKYDKAASLISENPSNSAYKAK